MVANIIYITEIVGGHYHACSLFRGVVILTQQVHN